MVTNAQQDNELRGLEASLLRARVSLQGNLGVIRFPVQDRSMAPYFLLEGDSGWMLDFDAMNRLIRFNHQNRWHFVRTDHAFAFAFTDLRFDSHGFPQAEDRDPVR